MVELSIVMLPAKADREYGVEPASLVSFALFLVACIKSWIAHCVFCSNRISSSRLESRRMVR